MTVPLLTVLNFSGGSQSTCIGWRILLGEIEVPKPFLFLMADPGAESFYTYLVQEEFFEKAREAGYEAAMVQGRNLLRDLTALDGTQTRIDNPPFWVKKPDGKKGRIKQKCTGAYKVAPMDRYIRQLLWQRHQINPRSGRLGVGVVEKWIGFAADEQRRAVNTASASKQKYVRFRFPLIEWGMTKADVSRWYREHNIPEPPRSMCNFCFAYGLRDLKKMHDERPMDWQEAVAVDEAIRHNLPMIEGEAYVSQSLIPLKDLPEKNFLEGADEALQQSSCDTFGG